MLYVDLEVLWSSDTEDLRCVVDRMITEARATAIREGDDHPSWMADNLSSVACEIIEQAEATADKLVKPHLTTVEDQVRRNASAGPQTK